MLKRAFIAGLVLLAGCSQCKSPLDDTPGAVATLPANRSLVLAFDKPSSRLFVIDPAERKLSRWTGPDALFQAPNAPISGAWWRPALQRIFVRAGSIDYTLVALRRNGESERVLQQSGSELTAAKVNNGCALSPDASKLICWGHEVIEGKLPQTYRANLRIDSLVPGTPPRLVRWSAPVAETGTFAPLGDASTVLYSDRCEGAELGSHCLYRATNAGDARTLVATLPGNVCFIEPSPDGRFAAVASRTESYDQPCSELSIVALEPPQRAPVRTSFLASAPKAYRGIEAIAWSPDGAQLAVTSDHVEGCAGSMGISVCSDLEYVVQAAQPGFQALGSYAHEHTALVWLPGAP